LRGSKQLSYLNDLLPQVVFKRPEMWPQYIVTLLRSVDVIVATDSQNIDEFCRTIGVLYCPAFIE
jgi:hypothetical protein